MYLPNYVCNYIEEVEQWYDDMPPITKFLKLPSALNAKRDSFTELVRLMPGDGLKRESSAWQPLLLIFHI